MNPISRLLPSLSSRRKAALALTFLLLLATATGWRSSHSRTAAAEDKPKPSPNRLLLAEDSGQLAFLRTEAARLADLPASEPMNARLALDEDLTARIFTPLQGRVVTLQAALGDRVEPGKALAVIDSSDFGQAIADLHKAQADDLQKKKSLARARTLYEGEAIARRELEAAEADAQAAGAEAERARLKLANLSPARTTIDGQRLVLRAPLGGTIVDRQANPGTEVRPDAPTPLYVISDLSRLWLNIDLPEKTAALATPGQVVRFTVDAYPGTDFTARIERVAAIVDAATRRIPVRAMVDNGNGRLKPEMFARATISSTDQPPAIRVPVAALLTNGLATQLFVQTGPREFERRPVAVMRQDAEFAYLAAGPSLHVDDRIVIRGALLLASELAQGE